MLQGLAAALELAGDAFRLIDEEHHDVEGRLAEMMGLGRVGELPPQQDHLVVEHLQALDLDLGPRKSIEHPSARLFAKPVGNNPAHQFVGQILTAVEKRLRGFSEFGLIFDLLAKHRTGAEVAET